MTINLFYNADISGETISSRVDFSPNQTDWNSEADEVVTAGDAAQLPRTRTFTSTGAVEEPVPVISIPLNDRWARLMVKNSASTGVARAIITMSKVGS